MTIAGILYLMIASIFAIANSVESARRKLPWSRYVVGLLLCLVWPVPFVVVAVQLIHRASVRRFEDQRLFSMIKRQP
ncbi:hypothetical protein M2418_003865 [Rhizobium sp. BIGb0125]|jgi:hypothetical protein|nr:hypothetical protein [Rhizobium sp. BIGb0125]